MYCRSRKQLWRSRGLIIYKLQQSTAILFFSRSASAEARQKRLFAPYKANKKIYTAFISQTQKIINQTGLPHFILNEEQQLGNSFGQKLSNGIQSIFSKGFNNVIVLGNDCLQIDANTINTAASSLVAHNLVLGPTPQGGVYVIGVTHAGFAAIDFEQIPWQSPSVFEELKNIAGADSCKCLQVLADINTRYDVLGIKNYVSKQNRILKLITTILSSLVKKESYCFIIPYNFYKFQYTGIPPPQPFYF